MTEKILILGATGLLGEPVTRHLKEDGFDVRIMARDTAKAERIFGEGYEIVKGDAECAADIAEAMEGCQAVHLSLSGEVELAAVQQVAHLAREKGIGRISYISGCTVMEDNRWFPMIDNKLHAEDALHLSGAVVMVFAPTWPMEMLPRYARGGKPLLIGRQTFDVHFYAAADLARMISTAYQMAAESHQRFIIHGPEAVPFKGALLRYCKVFHPEVTKVSGMPVWFVKLLAMLMRNDLMKFGADLAGYFDRVGELGDPSETNRLLGPASVTLDEWLSLRK
jgi:uncharacterized protein YbjT (DUF2867 family)